MNSQLTALGFPCAVSLVLGATALVNIVEERTFDRHAAIRNQFDQPIVEIELDHLSLPLSRNESFSSDKLPQLVRQLDNKRVCLRGYMQPTFEQTGITEFVLSGETRSKGYSWSAGLKYVPIHYYIDVILQNGLEAEYDHTPFIVEGTLRIKPELVGGKILTLFRLEDATLKPTKPRDGFHPAVSIGC